jgi:hypothetical protein
MVLEEGVPTSSPWEQFGLRNNFGKWENVNSRKESAKAKKNCMKGLAKLPRRKKKKKDEVIRELFQSHFMEDGGISHGDAEAFGDLLSAKPAQTFRCASHNIQMLPESAHHHKSKQLINFNRNSECDLIMMQEIGLYWNKLDPSDQWAERVMPLPDSTSMFAHNTLEPGLSTKLQYGGAGIVATSEVRHRMTSRGKDPSDMGRWVWMRMQGKEGHYVRFITAYRPCLSGGTSSVFQQQSRALTTNCNPRTVLLEDLTAAMIKWKALGDHIILGMDANEDVCQGEIRKFLAPLGLREIILELHHDLSPPATQNRNTSREPIDGMWASRGISISRGGYLAFGDSCPSDHRSLWFDASYSVAFGQQTLEMAPLNPKRLKASDPRLAARYNKRVKGHMDSRGFRTRFYAFKLRAQIDWNYTLPQDYNALVQEDTAIRKGVENKLRKLCMGGVP